MSDYLLTKYSVIGVLFINQSFSFYFKKYLLTTEMWFIS